MTISCLPNNGHDIKAGFNCSVDWTGGGGTSDNIVLVPDGQGGNMYIDTAWSGGDIMTSFLLIVLIVIILAKSCFEFLLPKIIKITRKQ